MQQPTDVGQSPQALLLQGVINILPLATVCVLVAGVVSDFNSRLVTLTVLNEQQAAIIQELKLEIKTLHQEVRQLNIRQRGKDG